MANEILACKAWLKSVLAANTAGAKVWEHPAPSTQSRTVPYITYMLQDGHDVNGIAGARIMISSLWLVRVICQTSDDNDIAALAAEIDGLLQKASGANAHGAIFSCHREEPFLMVQSTDGVEIRHLGGIYRIYAQ